MKVKIGGILDMSTIDYPGKIATVVYFYGCDFRCPFCYNFGLVTGEDYQNIEISALINEIKENMEFIDALAVTGGEPILQGEELEELCKKAKGEGLLVKIDTNGTRPDVVKKLIDKKLADFFSMDIKASPIKYEKMAGVKCDLDKIRETMEIFRKSVVDYELRTTIVPGQNDTEEDVKDVCNFIKPAKLYVLQQFRSTNGTLDRSLSDTPKTSRDLLLKLAETAKNQGLKVKIRTEENGEEEV